MLTVMPCPRSHLVHATASSSDAGCLSRVMVALFHPWRRGELTGTVDAEGVGVKRRLSAGDSFEGADRDVRRTGLRERLKRSRRNLCVGVRRSCLCTRSRAGESEERCENDSCNVH
jgi:hypothetical protein